MQSSFELRRNNTSSAPMLGARLVRPDDVIEHGGIRGTVARVGHSQDRNESVVEIEMIDAGRVVHTLALPGSALVALLSPL